MEINVLTKAENLDILNDPHYHFTSSSSSSSASPYHQIILAETESCGHHPLRQLRRHLHYYRLLSHLVFVSSSNINCIAKYASKNEEDRIFKSAGVLYDEAEHVSNDNVAAYEDLYVEKQKFKKIQKIQKFKNSKIN